MGRGQKKQAQRVALAAPAAPARVRLVRVPAGAVDPWYASQDFEPTAVANTFNRELRRRIEAEWPWPETLVMPETRSAPESSTEHPDVAVVSATRTRLAELVKETWAEVRRGAELRVVERDAGGPAVRAEDMVPVHNGDHLLYPFGIRVELESDGRPVLSPLPPSHRPLGE